MRMARKAAAVCAALMLMLLSAAQAEVPFLVHAADWSLDDVPVELDVKAAVETHMPFDEDRLAMLTPITDLLSMKITTGQDAGKVSIGIDQQEILSLAYNGNNAQLSCMPEVTYTAQEEPLSLLLGADVSGANNGYELLGLAPEGESLVRDGRALLTMLPEAFEAYGKKSQNGINVSGYGKATYRIDYNFAESKAGTVKQLLLEYCPEGWLKQIVESLTFKGKQTFRLYFTAEDEIIRLEYNGGFGPEGDIRTGKLVGRFLHNESIDKDYIELTTPAKKGKNKNNLTFERTVETNKQGVRTIVGDYKYTVTKDNVTSVWAGDFSLNNAFTDAADMITGEATFQTKLNDAERYSGVTYTPELTISGTADAPEISGTLTVCEKFGNNLMTKDKKTFKVTEKAVLSIAMHRAEPFAMTETAQRVDLSGMDEAGLNATRKLASEAIATTLVRELIGRLGKDAAWFFQDLPEDAVQKIVDAAK